MKGIIRAIPPDQCHPCSMRLLAMRFFRTHRTPMTGFEGVAPISHPFDRQRNACYLGGNAGPLGRYVAGKLTRNGDRFRVKVHCIASGKKDKEPSVEPELVFNKGRWLFVNFRYAEGKEDNDLMSILKLLREERQKNPQ